jgi:ketosteroid isomerase-like protein
MANESKREGAAAAMRAINQAWLGGRVEDLGPMLHPDVVMAVPGSAMRAQGREQFLAGFRDFCQNARVEEFREHDHQVDVAGNIAVVAYRYEMTYERSGRRSRSTGRDMWVFEQQGNSWIAVWRTMLDMQESAA